MNKFFIKKFLLIFTILIFGAEFSFAEKISFNADKMSGTAGNKNNKTVLKGNAKVITETMEIFADYIELSGKDFRFIKASGNVNGVNKESQISFKAENLSYDRQTKIAVLENKVELTDTENDVHAKAEVIEYNQELETAVMQIEIELKQKDNVCSCAYAVYYKKEQRLTMNGNPQIIQNTDTFKAQSITLDMETQEITLSGRVKGSVTTEKKETDNEQPDEQN